MKQLQSKLKSFQKLIIDDKHYTWTSEKYNQTFFGFVVEFENGDKGNANSTKEEGNYIIETEYTYIKEIKEVKGRMITNIKGINKLNNNFTQQKSTYNDPNKIKQMTLSVCQSAAINLFSKEIVPKKNYSEEMTDKIANKFYLWVIKEKIDRDTCSLRWNAIMRSIEILTFIPIPEITTTDWVIKNSEYFMSQINKLLITKTEENV